MESVWYYARDGAQQGPVSFDALKVAAAAGQIRPDDLVWKEGTADWVPGKTVAGLFPSAATPPAPPSYPVAPPVAPPARPRAPEPRQPIHDSPLAAKGPPPTGMEIVELAKIFLQRTVNPNPGNITPTPEEEQQLVQAGYDPIAQKFAAWRRAVLWVAVVPTAFAAFFRLVHVIVMEKDDLSGFGSTLFFVSALCLVALPVTAALAALSYDRLTRSTQLVLFGGLVSVAGPVLVAFTPTDLMIDLRGGTRVGSFTIALLLNVVLIPLVLSLAPALGRGCVRTKALLPESLVSGWALVASLPLLVLLSLLVFQVLYHLAGNALLFFALILIVGAPLLYLTKSKLLTRPLTDPQEIQSLAKPQLMVLIAVAFGVLLLIIYMFTAKFGEKTILGWERDKSFTRLWSASFNATWLEYLGRSLFMTVLFADLLMRMSIMVWREDRAFAGTAAAPNFDRTMSGLGASLETKGMPPVA